MSINRNITVNNTASLPLTGSEAMYVVQNGLDRKITSIDLINLMSTLGFIRLIGNWDASSNVFPSASVLKGYQYRISVAGILGGVEVSPGAKIMALVDSPGQTLTNWDIIF
jgi:hypothetical protein